MEAKFSYSVLKSSLPFSVTAIIYVIIFIPIAVKQFLAAFNGPIQNKPALQFFLTLWFLCAGNFTSLMNLIFYGVLSKVLRQEVAVRVKYRFSRVSLRVQQIRSLNADSSSHSSSAPVRQSVNERRSDFDTSSNSNRTETFVVAFFDDDD
ncbi:uncharacterized protein LOC142354398 [Convolutriloba macropyga]|uniref:uncharacterized protein LOC142354398 n=1 Tax=Convolutriloba macropyga TaxID=536237 RepID=UPI003F5245D4